MSIPKIEVLPIEEGATPDPNNTNKHTARGGAMLGNSLQRRGAFRSIASAGKDAETPVVYAGNLTLERAVEAGFTEIVNVHVHGDQLVNVVRDDVEPGSPEAVALGLEDNEIGKQSYSPDLDVIAALAAGDGALLAALKNEDKVFGGMLERMGVKDELVDAEPQIDHADELREKLGIEIGQLWQLGEHRIICGDSAKQETIEKLMNGEKAKLFCTDPPYGVSYGDLLQENLNRTKHWERIENDNLSGEDTQKFLESVFKAWLPHLDDNAAWYIWHAQKVQGYFTAAAAADVIYHRQIVWVKKQMVLGRGHFHWRHELCLYGWRKGHEPRLPMPRNVTTVWEFERDASSEYQHPTQKPIDCFARPMQYSTNAGDICAEPFCGSGSQIIAGEGLGRRVFASEIDPKYVAVAIQRWSDLAGKTPVRLE